MKVKNILLIVFISFVYSNTFSQVKNKFSRKSNNVIWEIVSVSGERDSKVVKMEMTFTNVGEIDKAIETFLFTITDNNGNIYKPDLFGETSWLFRPNSYSIATLLSGVPVKSIIYIENFSPSAVTITALSITIKHRFADKPGTPNGEPNSNLLIKNIPIIWD